MDSTSWRSCTAAQLRMLFGPSLALIGVRLAPSLLLACEMVGKWTDNGAHLCTQQGGIWISLR